MQEVRYRRKWIGPGVRIVREYEGILGSKCVEIEDAGGARQKMTRIRFEQTYEPISPDDDEPGEQGDS